MNRPERPLTTNGPLVSPLGLGTWPIAGPFFAGKQPLGWGGGFDRARSIAVLRAAFDSGITLFDTADVFGAGTAERLIGEALSDVRDEIAIVTKWGNLFDEGAKQATGIDSSPEYVTTALEASLDRLGTDHVDLYMLHLGELEEALAADFVETLENLRVDGKIRSYGWSTNDPDLARAWIGHEGFGAVQFEVNVVRDSPVLLAICDRHGVTGLATAPLATGLLTGAHTMETRVTDTDDLRRITPEWLHYFEEGRPVARYMERVDAIKEILGSDGRTIAQGALAWLWARSPNLIPVPGAQTVEQVTENARAMDFGPLTPDQMAEIDSVLTELRE